jgi:hypothetical protein
MDRRVVYLDFDGVVVTSAQRQDNHRNYLCPVKVGMVKDLCDRANALVVISSTWRVSHDCRDALANAGLPNRYLYPDWATPLDVDDDHDQSIRGIEIDTHVKLNDISNYVILDDMPVLDNQRSKHIQTDINVGITQPQIDLAFDLITNPNNG